MLLCRRACLDSLLTTQCTAADVQRVLESLFDSPARVARKRQQELRALQASTNRPERTLVLVQPLTVQQQVQSCQCCLIAVTACSSQTRSAASIAAQAAALRHV